MADSIIEGSEVHHYNHGKGVVVGLVSNGLAEVRFGEGLKFVEAKNLILARRLIEEEKRRKRKEKEKADHEEMKLKERQETKRREEEREKLLQDIHQKFHTDFINVDSYFRITYPDLITTSEYEGEKIKFIKTWIFKNTASDNKGNKKVPDDEQAAAIGAVQGHVQVVARAGSGKTTTLVNRTFFLLKHCGIPSNEILLLAFNRKAAMEIRKKLLFLLDHSAEKQVTDEISKRGRKAIQDDNVEANIVDSIAKLHDIMLPHVMTFHALAYAIVHPEESILYNGPRGESQELSRVFQQVIDEQRRDKSFSNRVRELMLAHFREDWSKIVAGKFDQSKEELLKYRRSLPRESINGEYVKSYGEKVIADFLFEHDILYKYERNHWWGNINYRPDFTVFKTKKSGIVIEYFGLRGDAEYDEMSQEKRIYWSGKRDWVLLEFFPCDVVSEGEVAFRDLLKSRLEEHGIQCTRLSEDVIWNRIKDRAIDRFTAVAVNFIGRCRKGSLSPCDLQDLINTYTSVSPVEKMFLDLAHHLYGAYLERLSASGDDDFDGLIQRAEEEIQRGNTVFRRKDGNGDIAELRYICIDEFQDFSNLFFRLLKGIEARNPRVELFCVGDDWQAINGFAGSDLKYFESFEETIGKGRKLYIRKNYRSSKKIVEVGNALMSGLGEPSLDHKNSIGKVFIADLEKFQPSLIEKQRHPGDIITPAVSRLTHEALVAGVDVVMLSRRNSLPWFINYEDQKVRGGRGLDSYLDLIRSFHPKDLQELITISTAHKYKGLEKPVVIILDAVKRSFPLIHPDWIFSRILGDSPEKINDEERRLMYVALTRAVDTLVIITEGRNKSPFLETLVVERLLSPIDWSNYPPVSGAVTRLVVHVGNQTHRGMEPTFSIKEALKINGYRWRSTGNPGWAKTFNSKDFHLDILKKELWAQGADGIEVCIYDEQETLMDRFYIDNGVWVVA